MTKLRVGILGLGRRWRRHYRPALHALRDRFVVRAVWDAMPIRAARQARQLRCRAAEGIIELLEGKDTDAILLLDAAWHGLWPLEAANRFGKPVFCAVPLEADATRAESICNKTRQAGLPVMMALMPRCTPANVRLQSQLAERLGAPRLLLCEQRGRSKGPIGVDLLDWCIQLFGGAPVSISSHGDPTAGIEEAFADFGEGRAAYLRRWWGPHVSSSIRMHVVAGKGAAWVGLPHRLRWNDADGRHAWRATEQRPMAEVMLERFYDAVAAREAMLPSLEDARRAFGILRASTR
jgi:predicted dehydrogenase